MTTSIQGRHGEAIAAAWFTTNGYDVYMPAFGNAKYDMIVAKDGKTQTVEVKSSTRQKPSGKYEFQLRKVRSNRTKTVVTNFDALGIDILCMVVVPTGKVYPMLALDYHDRQTICLEG